MFLLQSITDNVQLAQRQFRKHSKVKRLVFGSFLAIMATVLQGAGEFLPGIGYLISPFATFPLLLGTMFSLQMGVMAYLLTIGLLFLLIPSELIIFPFTTGLFGLSIGAAFSFFKKRISIISAGAFSLTAGIMGLLYLFRFPVLGPAVSDSFSFIIALSILLFSFFYAWLWSEMGLFFFKKIIPHLT